jgi:hypothetical protein
MERRTGAIAFPIAVFALLVAVAAPGRAQPRADESVDHAHSGVVTVVDPVKDTFTLADRSGLPTTVVVDDETTLIKGSKRVALTDLAKGDHVVADWDDESGRNLATYVEVIEDPGTKLAAIH